MAVSPQRQVLVGVIGCLLGLAWMAAGLTAAGQLFVLVGALGVLLGVYRWRHERIPAPGGVRMDEQYLLAVGLMFVGLTIYLAYRCVVLAPQNPSLAVVALVGTLLGLGLSAYSLGGIAVIRRNPRRRAGRLITRLYPRLANGGTNGNSVVSGDKPASPPMDDQA
ncbi:MAG: hypothetical protein ACREMY_03195 [bacterium]